MRSQTRARQRLSALRRHKGASTSDRQLDAAARRLRAARPLAPRNDAADGLGRLKYTVPIEGRGPPGHRVTQAWLSALAQSDASSGTP